MAFLDTHGLQTFKGLLDNLFSKKLNTTLKGAANGLAELDSSGKVPSSQLPSYVDDVLEYTKQSDFPATGETGKIYVAKDTNKTYRWSGSAYVEISASLALGETSSTAYRGDRGKTAYDHATASGSAFTSGLYKITTNAQGHVTAATAVAKADITALGIPGSDTNNSVTQTATSTDADYEILFSGTADNTTRTEGARKTNTLTYNPNTKELLTGGSVDGFTLNAASAKAVDSSIDAASTSVNLPTSAAVASFVEGKGYKTTDTKNTTGSTNTSSKIFLVGATSQAANPQTYSHDTAYVGTDGCLYSGGAKVLTAHQDISGKKNTQSAVSDPSASGTSTTFIKTITQNAQGVITPTKASLPTASTSTAGIVQLNDTLSSTSTTQALTAKQGKTLNDNKAPTASPVFTGSISMGKKSDYTMGTSSLGTGIDVGAPGNYSQAQGNLAYASGESSHAEGHKSSAYGNYSHAEGQETTADATGSHAEGYKCFADGSYSHAEGSNSEAHGSHSHVEGEYTYNKHANQHVFGYRNATDPSANGKTASGTYLEIVGNGLSSYSNARTLDWSGNERLKGDIYVNCSSDSSGGTALGAAISKINSNENETTDILASAVNCTKTTFFKTSGSSSYVGTLPSNSYKVSTFIVNVRGGGRFVTATNSEGCVATNYYNGSSWAGWQELALNDSIATQSATVAKANANYTYGNVKFEKTANYVMVMIEGFVSLPAQGYTDICAIPTGFAPSGTRYFDVLVGTNESGANLRTLRFRINGTTLSVYNYSTELSNANAEPSVMYIR